MFTFTIKDGWKEIEDFLITDEAKDGDQELVLAGFSLYPSINLGDTETNLFSVFVYCREFVSTPEIKHPEYEFLVEIGFGGRCYYVAISALPDLLELLRQIVPLSISIDECLIKKEQSRKEQ